MPAENYLPALPGRGMQDKERLHVIGRVTIIGAVVDLVLAACKISGGLFANSHALVADGLHSLSDLATDVLVLAAAKAAHVQADQDHPYGHARIETVATVGLGLVLILVALGIVADSGQRILGGAEPPPPFAWAIWIAAASVVAKEALYHYTMHHARTLSSPLLEANAWHSRSDAVSSLVVIAGVGGSLAGWIYLDIVAALVVGAMIAHIGFRLGKQGLAELIDTGLDVERLAQVRETIMGVDGVQDLHELRTRSMAGRALIDVHLILTDPRISVSEGHQISETVRARLIRRLEDVEDVMVHIDPEDDERYPMGQNLGLRSTVMSRLGDAWGHIPSASDIVRVDLHYLQGQIQLRIELPMEVLSGGLDPVALEAELANALGGEEDIGSVEVVFSVAH